MFITDPILIQGTLGRVYAFTRCFRHGDLFGANPIAFFHDRAFARQNLYDLVYNNENDPFNYELLNVWQLVFQKPWTQPHTIHQLVNDLADKIGSGHLFVYLEKTGIEEAGALQALEAPSLDRDGPALGLPSVDYPRVSLPPAVGRASPDWRGEYTAGLTDTVSSVADDIAVEQAQLYERTAGWGNVTYPVFKPVENAGRFVGNTVGLLSAMSPRGMNPEVANYWREMGESFKALGARVTEAIAGDGRAAGELTPAITSFLLTRKVPDPHRSGLDKLVPEGEFEQGLDVSTQVPVAAEALSRKMSALEDAQRSAIRVEVLEDGRTLYFSPERPARNPGPTRGAALVTELEPQTGRVRQYYEAYDHGGAINRVHPKMIDGQIVDAPHYPPTQKEVNGN